GHLAAVVDWLPRATLAEPEGLDVPLGAGDVVVDHQGLECVRGAFDALPAEALPAYAVGVAAELGRRPLAPQAALPSHDLRQGDREAKPGEEPRVPVVVVAAKPAKAPVLDHRVGVEEPRSAGPEVLDQV